MAIYSPNFDDLILLQTDLLSIISGTIASLSTSLYKMDFWDPLIFPQNQEIWDAWDMVHQSLALVYYNKYSTQGKLISPFMLTATTSPMLALVY